MSWCKVVFNSNLNKGLKFYAILIDVLRFLIWLITVCCLFTGQKYVKASCFPSNSFTFLLWYKTQYLLDGEVIWIFLGLHQGSVPSSIFFTSISYCMNMWTPPQIQPMWHDKCGSGGWDICCITQVVMLDNAWVAKIIRGMFDANSFRCSQVTLVVLGILFLPYNSR